MPDSSAHANKTTERPTLKTIAKITGLAVATVSRALNDAPDIGAATKRRVRQVALEIGYRPNRAGVRLRTGRTQVVSLVLSTEEHVMNHTAKLIYSVSAALRPTAYHMIVTPYQASDDPMDPIRYIVETRSADGVIINQIEPNDRRVRYMAEHGFPFATHGRSELGIEHPYYDFDNERFAFDALKMLASRQRKHVYFVAPPANQSYSQHMRAGIRRITDETDLRVTVAEAVTSDSPFAAIEADVGRAMAGADRPDAIVGAAASACVAAVLAAEKAGLKIGGDIDAVGKEAVPFLKQFRDEILVVQEDVAKAGSFLTDALLRWIEDPDAPLMQRVDSAFLRG